MIILFHVFVALSSIAYTTYLYLSPQTSKFLSAYLLVGFTLASGTYLVIESPAQMIRACVSGLIYLSIVTFGLASARKKLANQENSID